jgi:hypothetical protein
MSLGDRYFGESPPTIDHNDMRTWTEYVPLNLASFIALAMFSSNHLESFVGKPTSIFTVSALSAVAASAIRAHYSKPITDINLDCF